MKIKTKQFYCLFHKLCGKITLLLRYIFLKFYPKPTVHNTDATIEKLLSSTCSMSRFGDGEFGLIFGQNIAFQKFDSHLQSKLMQILKVEKNNHIACIPYTLINLDNLNEKPYYYWRNYFLKNRLKIYKSLNFNKIYFDSLVSRLY